ncbi:heavy-metal-associated domain-containing protein [Lutibacter flavus]|uniref:Copper chaperone n=1 Tax=Lutibacter flavus TaxID=691689 RepID=A0A238ZKY1_9FLAO|nr:heavy-metal-associated domain-containing protein [Lutibacter flavus]SNR83970.1 copper chaperone [Lutibacter flavus]
MENLKFKTNINCTGCLSKVSPQLNNEKGIEEWDVDLNNSQKILTVKSNSASEEDVVSAVKKVGFNIERIG